jgi:hypothetical protein
MSYLDLRGVQNNRQRLDYFKKDNLKLISFKQTKQ